MKTTTVIIYLFFLILPIIELYSNYNVKDFPEFHDKRIKFDICSIFASLFPILFIMSLLCGPCCLCIYIVLLFTASIAAIYYTIVSFYLYFAYNGGNRIKSRTIRILLWMSLINFLINFISNCCCSNPTSSYRNRNSNVFEIDEQRIPLLSNQVV